MNRLAAMLLFGLSVGAMAGTPAPESEFENSACIECHQQQDAGLVTAWRNSVHATAEQAATCVGCHGSRHGGAASRARRDSTCVDCHGGVKAPAVHSYATSKHGILTRLEQNRWDWEQPLESANYRSPGCAYCHMHKGNHDASAGVRAWNSLAGTEAAERERVQDDMRAVCQDCHSPRYISRLFDNGERMLDVGRMKVREAAGVLAQAAGEFTEAELAAARSYFEQMQSRHLKNILLGIGHQSPDYQWWHGQPALDGDLLRIKGELGRLRRLTVSDTGKDGE
jgi:hypothetical protein